MRFAYTRPDGGVSVVYAASREQLSRTITFNSDKEYEQHIIERSIPPGASNIIKLPDGYELPPRETRLSWRIVNGVITV